MRRNILAVALLVATAALMYARWPRYEASDTPVRAQSTSDIGLTWDAQGRPIASADAQLDSGAAVRTLAEVQVIADTAKAERVAAPALLRAGLLKLRLHAADIDSSAAVKRPHEYFYNEIAGSWLYNGADFDSLGRRFPSSALADDAAYARLFLIPGGECEGYVPCRVGFAVQRPVDFLRWHPESPHVARVVSQINSGVELALRDLEDPDWPTDSYDPGEVRDYLRLYDTATKRLPSPARDSVVAFLKQVNARFTQRPPAQEFRAGDIPPDVRVACSLADAIMREALTVDQRRDEGTFSDSYRGRPRVGCLVKAAGTYAQLDSGSTGPDDEVVKGFTRNRWVMDPRYDAAGPDGSVVAARLGHFLCIIDASWSGHDDSDTVKRKYDPAENTWDVTLECFRDTTRPPRAR